VSILLDCPHLLRVHNWCFGSGAGSKLGCLVHDVLVVFLFDCKLPHIRTDRDGRYVVDNFLDVLDELTCRLIVRLTLVNGAQIFPTPWCAHRCCLKLYQTPRFLVITSAPVDRAGLDMNNFEMLNWIALNFRVAIKILLADGVHQG